MNNKKICMVIGDPVEHSLSPVIHNAGYKALGIDADYEYIAVNVKAEDIEFFIEKIRTDNIAGISCTIPHKESIAPFLDHVEETAEKIGAVNTIVNKNGFLHGYNTDWIGATKPLSRLRDLSGSKVAVLGAGGAGRAFVYGMVKAGAKVTVYNRSIDKAKDLADSFSCEYSSLSEQSDIKSHDIICNTTSVGMDSDEAPVDKAYLHADQIVFDAVYSPLKTRLLSDAEEKGAKTIPGTELLLYQAFVQFKLFTNQEAPEEMMRQALMEYFDEK